MSQSAPPAEPSTPKEAASLLAEKLGCLLARGCMYLNIREDSPLEPLGVKTFGALLRRVVGRLRRAIGETRVAASHLDRRPKMIGRVEADVWLGELLEALGRLESVNNLFSMMAYTNPEISHADLAAFGRRAVPILGEVAIFRRNLNALRWGAGSNTGVAAKGDGADALTKAYRPCKEIADHYDVAPEALRKRLERWRLTHDYGFVENTNAAGNQPRFTYQAAAVMDEIRALQQARSLSVKCPTKKK